jgi:carotenoid cleavage dioxygenase
MPTTISPYLSGNFAPVTEEVTVTDLAVTGSIPTALAGRYLRTGPNPFTVGEGEYHWFSGTGMIHGVDLHDGDARWYRNRWVRTSAMSGELGEAPVPRDEGGWYEGTGNTNVFHHAGRIWAITEGSLPFELTAELDTVGAHNFGGPLPGGFNAHPKFDPATGELHVVSYGFDNPALRYHVIDARGHLVRTETFEIPAPVMVHDMGLTETQLVLLDLPVLFDLDAAMAGKSLPFRWGPENGARVGLMPRAGTSADTVWAEVDPCYVYHPLNAYDDGDRVVMDLVVHPGAFANEARDPGVGTPTLQRWTIDPGSRKVTTEVIDERGQEFPRADERLAGRRHRYGYSVGARGIDDFSELSADELASADATRQVVLKHDLVAGTTVEHDLGEGHSPSELVFVPASATAGEDEGWLVGYAYDAARGASDLVILDAHDFGEPVATVHLPVRVPQGFHGNWIPDRALS